MNQLTIIADDEKVLALPGALDALWASLEKSAARVLADTADLNGFTQVEQLSMLKTEMLRQSKGLDLASTMIKGRLLREIEQDGLFSIHPEGYRSLEELAAAQGISGSEYSQTRDLADVILPWIQERLGMSPMRVWQDVSKSNLRELVPVLKRAITGLEGRASVEESFKRVADEVATDMWSAGMPVEGEGLRIQIVTTLLDRGAVMKNAELRDTLRPDPVLPINSHLIRLSDRTVFIASLDDRQEQALFRALHSYVDTIIICNPDEHDLRSILRTYFTGQLEMGL